MCFSQNYAYINSLRVIRNLVFNTEYFKQKTSYFWTVLWNLTTFCNAVLFGFLVFPSFFRIKDVCICVNKTKYFYQHLSGTRCLLLFSIYRKSPKFEKQTYLRKRTLKIICVKKYIVDWQSYSSLSIRITISRRIVEHISLMI